MGLTVEIATAKRRTGGVVRRVVPQRLFWRKEIDLVLRGSKPWRRLGNRPLFIWLISQPDKLTDQEIEEAEHIFVASEPYAQKLKARGASVSWLPQCTDASLFSPDRFDAARKAEVLFVGNRRKDFERPVVELALKTGHSLCVWGRNWEGRLPDGVFCGRELPYSVLGAHYASARVVLNDHHPSMLAHGFVSNRLYDVLACGRPVLNEDMPGIPEDLRDAVFRYTPDTFARRLEQALDFCRQERNALSEHVRHNHSFDNRAREIARVIGKIR
ncbi:glycosyltransferase family protein [Rhodovulum marinum]|nr:glycosyltransferase [Rhodovulum marinum]